MRLPAVAVAVAILGPDRITADTGSEPGRLPGSDIFSFA